VPPWARRFRPPSWNNSAFAVAHPVTHENVRDRNRDRAYPFDPDPDSDISGCRSFFGAAPYTPMAHPVTHENARGRYRNRDRADAPSDPDSDPDPDIQVGSRRSEVGCRYFRSRRRTSRQSRPRRSNPDGLDVDELADAEFGEFAAIAGLLHAAEGEAGIGGDHAVDKHLPRLNLARQTARPREV